jgi:hypothetical protein
VRHSTRASSTRPWLDTHAGTRQDKDKDGHTRLAGRRPHRIEPWLYQHITSISIRRDKMPSPELLILARSATKASQQNLRYLPFRRPAGGSGTTATQGKDACMRSAFPWTVPMIAVVGCLVTALLADLAGTSTARRVSEQAGTHPLRPCPRLAYKSSAMGCVPWHTRS